MFLSKWKGSVLQGRSLDFAGPRKAQDHLMKEALSGHLMAGQLTISSPQVLRGRNSVAKSAALLKV